MPQTLFSATAHKQEKERKEAEARLRQTVEETQQKKSEQETVFVEEKEEPEMSVHQMKHHMPAESEFVEKPRGRDPKDYSEVLRHEHGRTHWFSAFIPQPKNTTFESQHPEEKILLVLRQHALVNLQWIVIALVLLALPFVLFPLFPFMRSLPGSFSFFAVLGWCIFVFAYALESFLNWYYNIYIITDERIVDVDFYSMLYKSVSEAKLEKIEDITATTSGVLGAIFNYGDINLQTAAEKREFEFLKVPQPAKVTKFLNELLLEEEREKIEGRVM